MHIIAPVDKSRMTKLDHHHHVGATNHMKKGKKKESKLEEENDGDEWVDEDEDDPQAEPVVFDLSALKQQIDRLVAQQGLNVTSVSFINHSGWRCNVIHLGGTSSWRGGKDQPDQQHSSRNCCY